MTLERRTQALLDLVESDRARRCESIIAAANSEAQTILKEAHAEARSRMRLAFAEERARYAAGVAAARARLQTQRRLDEQQRVGALLALAWDKLPDALTRRWHDADARRPWTGSVAAAALTCLPHAAWRVIHAADWPADEQREFVERVISKVGMPPQIVADSTLRAGIKSEAGGNVIDATLGGLLADRAEVGSRLLHALEVTP